MIIALVLVVVFSPIVFLVRVLASEDLAYYFYAIAVGLDQLGGSILYEQPDWTVSSWTYYLCSKGNKCACWFMKFIDFIFGKEHCKKAFLDESKYQLIRRKRDAS